MALVTILQQRYPNPFLSVRPVYLIPASWEGMNLELPLVLHIVCMFICLYDAFAYPGMPWFHPDNISAHINTRKHPSCPVGIL